MTVALLALLVGCTGTPVDTSVPGQWTDSELGQLRRLRLVPTPPSDPTNRYESDPGVRDLGSVLFFDPGLSSTGRVSCATCHDPAKHFADGLPLAEAIGTADRHTPTIVGSQWGPWFFWDGRADSLWAQALGPIESPVEMGSDRMAVARYVTTAYPEQWQESFGATPDFSDRDRYPERARPGATGPDAPHARSWEAMDASDRAVVDDVFAKIGKAIAAYERSLMPTDAPFDLYVDAVLSGDGSGGGHLTEPQINGLDLFLGRGECLACHNGPLFTDRAFHNNGVAEDGPGYDPGRRRGAPVVLGHGFNCRSTHSDATECLELDYLDPSFEDFQAAFKTPTLRYVAQTAPYFHNGSASTLLDVIEFYNELPNEPAVGHRELTLRPIHLSASESADLVAFLETLSGEPVRP